jgi:hypothetical protein
MARSGLQIAVFVVALIVAIFHALLVQFIVYSVSIGGYFLVTTILFAAGAFAALTSGKLLKPALIGLFLVALIDNALILITTSVPTPLSGGQVFGWGTDWNPPGQVQVLIAQIILMILTAYALMTKKNTP